MHSVIMLFFYGFLAGLAILFTGLGVKKRALLHTAQVLSTAGGTLAACCFLLILCCGYLSTLPL